MGEGIGLVRARTATGDGEDLIGRAGMAELAESAVLADICVNGHRDSGVAVRARCSV